MTTDADKPANGEKPTEAAQEERSAVAAKDEEPTEAAKLAREMLEKAVKWLDDANGDISDWETLRTKAKAAAPGASGGDEDDDEDDRKPLRYKADVWSRMAGVGLGASRQIHQAAAEELTRIQQKFFVAGIQVDRLDKEAQTAVVSVKLKQAIPNGYQVWWKVAGDPVVTPIEKTQWTQVEINASELPFGDTTIEVLVGKVPRNTKDRAGPWRYI
jgi:hypothetical protein